MQMNKEAKFKVINDTKAAERLSYYAETSKSLTFILINLKINDLTNR